VAAAESFDVRSVAELRAIVGEPLPRVITKELPALDERAAAFIVTAPFLIMATGGRDGSSDASPKGGPPGFVKVLNDARLAIPEFPGCAHGVDPLVRGLLEPSAAPRHLSIPRTGGALL